MKKFIQVDGNIITGTLIADSAPAKLPLNRIFVELAEDRDFPKLFSTYENGVITELIEPDYGLTVSPRTFLLLFTFIQRRNLRNSLDEDIQDFMMLIQISESIRLKHPSTTIWLSLLVAKGIISQLDRIRIANGIS